MPFSHPLATELPTPLGYFQLLLSNNTGVKRGAIDKKSSTHNTTTEQEEKAFPTLEACACIGQDAYPDCDTEEALERIDQWEARIQRRISPDLSDLMKLRILNQFFYRELGFSGNQSDPHNPNNLYLHKVIQTRRGLPVALAVIWLELAQAIGLNAHGVGFPGHFMLKVHLPEGQVVIEPLTGQSLSKDELQMLVLPFQQQAILQPIHIEDHLQHNPHLFDVGHAPPSQMDLESDIPLGLYLQSSTPQDMLVRILQNLKHIFINNSDWGRLLQVQQRLLLLQPNEWLQYLDRGTAFDALGECDKALADFEIYLKHAPKPLSAIDAQIAQRVQALSKSS